jgi:hypothetical protein
MLDNDLVQAALTAKANGNAVITASLPSGTIVEYNFQGTDFSYPTARLQIESQNDVSETNVHCPSQVDFSWYIFSEKSSSKECNQIAGKFVSQFRGLSFAQNNIKFVKIRILENIPAIREDERTWRAQIRCQSIIHNE